jgi:uncharacterized protein YceH (UPF0502 family)
MPSLNELPVLSPIEMRVLGSLIEKSRTTPDYYPMTLNGLTAACNQKTSRYPVSEYSESAIKEALALLKGQSLVANAIASGSRVVKYKHNFTTVFEMEPEELAILCLLMLRGPQTPGELNTNSSRLFEFKSLDHVHSVLNKLRNNETPFVIELSKRPGQKETRFAQLLGGEIVAEEEPHLMPQKVSNDLEERISELEKEVAALKEIISRLENKGG